MINIDVSSDIDAAMASVGDFFRSQIPFATAGALNNSIFDVRADIIADTWPKAFKVRNQALPRRLFIVKEKATKRSLMAKMGQDLDRDFVERQATGGTKRGKSGGRVAIPAEPEKMRTATGRIRAALKPGRLNGTRGVFSIKSGSRTLVMRRIRKRTVKLLYAVVPQANIRKRFMFDEDATATALRVFPGYWRLGMNAAIHSSRFKPL